MLIVLAASAVHAADEAPPAQLQAPKPEGGLSREAIQRTVDPAKPEIKGCYEVALNKDPDLAGRVVAYWVIAPDGTVSFASAKSWGVEGTGVEGCVLEIIRRLRFPQPLGGGKVDVTYPFVFSNSAVAISVRGPRRAADIERVVQGAAGAFESCMALRPKPGSAATVDVYFKVNAGGESREVQVSSKDLDSKASEACLTEKLKGLRFPPQTRPEDTIVSYPLRFLPPDAKPPTPTVLAPGQLPARNPGSCGGPW